MEGLRFKLVAGNYSFIYKKGTEREDPNLASFLESVQLILVIEQGFFRGFFFSYIVCAKSLP